MNEPALGPAPDIAWVVATRGVTLVSRSRGAFASIPYPHAGLWALLADGACVPERAHALMALLMAVEERVAAREVEQTLAAWRDAGWLAVT